MSTGLIDTLNQIDQFENIYNIHWNGWLFLQHDVGRAADFWIDGFDGVDDGEPLFCAIKNSGLVDWDYEVSLHILIALQWRILDFPDIRGRQPCNAGRGADQPIVWSNFPKKLHAIEKSN